MIRRIVVITTTLIALYAILFRGWPLAATHSGPTVGVFPVGGLPSPSALASQPHFSLGPTRQISNPADQLDNAEVELAASRSGRYVYAAWIGVNEVTGRTYDIRFAASDNGGKSFGRSIGLPGSAPNGRHPGGPWDPAVAVGPNGTVYVSFMIQAKNTFYPVVEASFDHGRTFPQVSYLRVPPKDAGNFGDRDFLAVAPNGSLYLTWDFSPSAASVDVACPPHSSCYFKAGELNIVVQKSVDGGKSWRPMIHVTPGFPNGGADSAPLLVQRNGHVDVDFQAYHVSHDGRHRLSTAHAYFTDSTNGGTSWSRPVRIGPTNPTMSHTNWWVDGDMSGDRAGNLYATWDTQDGKHDIGWLSYSEDHGRVWSRPRRVTPDATNALHIVEVSGGPAGMADVAWLSSSSPKGYGLYLREFSIKKGWLTGAVRVSKQFGRTSHWPGDTFGIAALPGSGISHRVLLSWASLVGSNANSRVIARVATFIQGNK